MKFEGVYEKTLILLKPDAVQRGLVGEITARLERKGLKLVGLKMMMLTPELLKDHYSHIVDKPFYPEVEGFMLQNPVVVLCAEGRNAVEATIQITGVTNAAKADAGTIRGDYALGMSNVIHRSDSVEAAKEEVNRFFNGNELFDYDKTDWMHVYLEEERG